MTARYQLLQTSHDRRPLRELNPVAVRIPNHRNPRRGAEGHWRQGFAATGVKNTFVFVIYFENLKGDVSPSLPLKFCIAGRMCVLLQQDHSLAYLECETFAIGPLWEAKCFGIKAPVGVQVTHTKADSNLRDTLGARRNKRYRVTIRIGEACRLPIAGDEEFQIPSGRRLWDRFFEMIDF